MMENYAPWIHFVPTSYCPFLCEHCGCNSGPNEKGSMTLEQAFFYIEQMPELRTETVQISGGEPTTYEHFYELIDAIGKAREDTGYLQNTFLITNGKGFGEKEVALKKLRHLTGKIDKVYVSNDQFHRKFNNSKSIKNLRELSRENGVPSIFFMDQDIDVLCPVGRAKNIRMKYEEDAEYCGLCDMVMSGTPPNGTRKFVFSRSVSVTPEGIYACDWKRVKIGEPGERIDDVVERYLKEPANHVIGLYGIRGAIREVQKLGDAKWIDTKKPECMVCEEFFNDEKAFEAMKQNSRRILKDALPIERERLERRKGSVSKQEFEDAIQLYDFQESLLL